MSPVAVFTNDILNGRAANGKIQRRRVFFHRFPTFKPVLLRFGFDRRQLRNRQVSVPHKNGAIFSGAADPRAGPPIQFTNGNFLHV